jgi:DNA-binding CsgD family transcriptional regulator
MQANAIPQMHQNALSPRELEIIYYLAWGFSDKEVAHQLNISTHTVRTHHGNINIKTNSRNLADVARWYFETHTTQSFGIRPTLARIMAVCVFLLLIVIGELINSPMIRTRSIKTAKVARRARAKRNNTLTI